MRLLPLVLLTAASAALAQVPADLEDLVGARGASGETQLQARGYRHSMTNSVGDTKWSFWFNDRNGQCVSVATSDGRYASIARVPPANCNAAPGSSARPDVRAPGNAGRDGNIRLVCIGAGSGPAAADTSGYRYNNDSRKFEYQSGTTLVREGFASDVEIEISNGQGRIHPSGKLVSPIHSNGVDGWWSIDELSVSPDRISGKYRMNGFNKPRIDYDRRTRIIHINAATDFTGRCEEH